MKTFSRILLVALFFLFIWLTRTFGQTQKTLQYFDGISVTGNITVILEKGDQEEATIYADGIPEDKVKVKNDQGTLKFKLLNSVFYKDDEVKIYVTYSDLRYIKGQAGAVIRNKGTLNGDKLKVVVNSGANVDLSVETNALNGSVSEGGILELDGRTGSQTASAATGGQYEAGNMESSRTFVKAGTGGQATVFAIETLEASANTGGVIEYEGRPKEKSVRKLLGGTVRGI